MRSLRHSVLLLAACALAPLTLPAVTAAPAAAAPAAVAPAEFKLGTASASYKDGVLKVATGAVDRSWIWTGGGLSTKAFVDSATGFDYAAAGKPFRCDWSLPGVLDDKSAGELISVTMREDDDAGLISKHIEVVSTVRYAEAKLEVRHVVWVFPGAPGVRTQLRVKGLAGWTPKGSKDSNIKEASEDAYANSGSEQMKVQSLATKGANDDIPKLADIPYKDCGSLQLRPGARADFLPLDLAAPNSRRVWGIYNDPGNRLPANTPMLREEVTTGFPVFRPEPTTWASGEAIEYGERGVAMIKESPKAVNQPAHLTGSFFAGPGGLTSTGWGLAPAEIVTDRFRECWAQWSLVYSGGNDGLQRAVKRFDAARYPVFPARDMFILSNTWGPANPGGAQFTKEDFVLKEIAAVGSLGIDVMQIDDGWQKSGGGPGAKEFLPKYKNGWKDIKAAADKAGVRLGLWVAIRNAKLEDLNKNLDELGYITWKADFEHLANRSDYESRIAKFRAVMAHAPGKTQFTLCPEYEDPRYGWYFAKEYGSIYFQNIQEAQPAHLTMVPFQVLRQHWLMAKYFPSNKLQVMLQNPKRTRKDLSDAWQHSHAYCFAMGLPFVPQFFQSAQFLDAEGQKELKELIAAYKGVRADLFTGTTYPIGDEPTNASWSGFQTVSTGRDGGFLTLFRELHNTEPKKAVPLKFLAGKTLVFTDVIHPELPARTVTVGADGAAEFEIANPADFRLLRYEVR